MNQSAEPDETEDRSVIVFFNLIVVISSGVAFSFWMIWFTGWFPVIGGLLGLTGAFAWLAFLSNLITEVRKKQAQKWLDRRILQSWWTLGALLALVFFFVIYASWRGTLVIDTLGDSASRTGQMRAENVSQKRFSVAARDETAFLLPTDFWGARTYSLKLDGLPEIDVEVRPWQRTRVITPGDFWAAPVVLVRPTVAMSGESIHGEFALIVSVDGVEWGRLFPYFGGSAWIGAADDVEIPSHRIDRWRSEFIIQRHSPALAQRWTTPASLNGSKRLKPGERVTATVVREADPQGGIQGTATVTIQPPRTAAGFPQELIVDINRN